MPERAATIAEVRLRLGASFTNPPITDAVVQLYLDDTACFIYPPAWGVCASAAHSYAAAHCVAMSPEAANIAAAAGSGSKLSSAKDGPASLAFSVTAPDASDGAWADSVWGRKYLEYRKQREGTGSAIVTRSARRAC